jgi:iron complex outermembrane receptor protein
MGQYTRQKGDFYRQVTGRAPCAGDQGGAILVGSVACGQTFDLKDKVALNQAPSPNDYHGKLVTLNARYNLSDRIGIVYVGGYNDTTYFTTTNLDFAGIGSANQVPLDFHATTKRRAISNELRLQSEGPGFYNFTYGLYQQNTRSDAIANLPPIFTGQPTRTTTNDYGVFTNQRFQFGPRDSVQLGVRYSKVDIKNRLDGSSRSYDAVTGNASYQHQFTQNVMAYASYGTAYRPGSAGANGSPVAGVIPASFGNFGDEKSHSVEIGMKTQWFNKRLTLNVALFDQKYKGYITSQFNVACTGVPNPNGLAFATNNGLQNGPQCFGTMTGNGNAVSRGIEVEARANVTRAWTISGIFTYTDAHFANASLPCNDYNGDGVLDVSGVPMVQKGQYVSLCKENGPLGSLPKVSFTANTSYDFNVGNIPAYIRLNSFTRGSSFFPQTGGTFAGYTIVNGSVGVLTSDRKWELSLWGKNLFNTVKEDSDGGPWTIYGVPSGLRVGTVTNNREVGVTLRRIF